MTWGDWVSDFAVGVVALAGIWATHQAGKRQTRTSVEVAAQQANLTREGRAHDLLVNSYVEILTWMAETVRHAQIVEVDFHTDKDFHMELFSEQLEDLVPVSIRALSSLGSEEVRKLIEEADKNLRSFYDTSNGKDLRSALEKITKTRDSMGAQIRAELIVQLLTVCVCDDETRTEPETL